MADDLWRAGEVPDPYYERNSLLLEWVPSRSWVCRRRLRTLPLGEAGTATLVFEGVDHRATVLLYALYGVPRAGKLAHLLSLAARAGANCLRGGPLESWPAPATVQARFVDTEGRVMAEDRLVLRPLMSPAGWVGRGCSWSRRRSSPRPPSCST